MERQFDLIVIGTGVAGSPVAHRCRQAGWNVAIVDSRPFGGTCALRGCDPKKVLVGVADVIDWTRRMQGKGVAGSDLGINWPELMRFKRTFTDPVPQSREQGFKDAGIATFHGRARFVGSTKLQVGEDVLTARFVHVAAGARPATLGIVGEEHLTTSDQFLELDELPKRITFVGGGYISFEFAHVAARAGAQVRIIHRASRPLEGFDADMVDKLVEASREIGIDVQLNRAVKSVEQTHGLTIKASHNGAEESFEADMVVHGAGRVPDIDDLDLDAANIKREKKGVSVNEYLQSVSNPAVYAAGDSAASSKLQLTPVASMHAQIVGTNILEGNRQKPNYEGIPTVIFTIPPLAAVGLQEEDAKKQPGLKFKTNYTDTSDWYSSRRINLKHSAFKVLIEENSGRILGAHLLGAHAEETINLFGLAIRCGLKAEDLRSMIYSYPTHASDVAHMLN